MHFVPCGKDGAAENSTFRHDCGGVVHRHQHFTPLHLLLLTTLVHPPLQTCIPLTVSSVAALCLHSSYPNTPFSLLVFIMVKLYLPPASPNHLTTHHVFKTPCWSFCAFLCDMLQARKAADEARAQAQMEAALRQGSEGASWGLLGPDAEGDADEDDEGRQAGGLDWRVYMNKHTLTDKQTKLVDQIRWG